MAITRVSLFATILQLQTVSCVVITVQTIHNLFLVLTEGLQELLDKTWPPSTAYERLIKDTSDNFGDLLFWRVLSSSKRQNKTFAGSAKL